MDWIERITRHFGIITRAQDALADRQARMASDLEQDRADIKTLVDAQTRTSTQLDTILRAIQENYQMSQADIDRLRASVETNTNAVASANALISGLSQQIRDAADDPAEIKALADQLDASNAALSTAVTANTPAAAAAAAPAGPNTGVPGATPSAIPGADALHGNVPAAGGAPAAAAAPAAGAADTSGDNSGGAAPAA